jgi:hypothetical protein
MLRRLQCFCRRLPPQCRATYCYFPAHRVRLLGITMVQAASIVKAIGVGSAAALSGIDLKLPLAEIELCFSLSVPQAASARAPTRAPMQTRIGQRQCVIKPLRRQSATTRQCRATSHGQRHINLHRWGNLSGRCPHDGLLGLPAR